MRHVSFDQINLDSQYLPARKQNDESTTPLVRSSIFAASEDIPTGITSVQSPSATELHHVTCLRHYILTDPNSYVASNVYSQLPEKIMRPIKYTQFPSLPPLFVFSTETFPLRNPEIYSKEKFEEK